jgi:hypothetical protein
MEKKINRFRSHSALNYQLPAPSAELPKVQEGLTLRLTIKVARIMGLDNKIMSLALNQS